MDHSFKNHDNDVGNPYYVLIYARVTGHENYFTVSLGEIPGN